MINIENISKSYTDAGEKRLILDRLNLSFGRGDSLSIQGASGSGKSTLLHLLAALDKPDSGRIIVDSNKGKADIVGFSETQADNYRKHQIGLVFQKFNLIDCISVWDNVKLPLQISGNRDVLNANKIENEEYLCHLLRSLDVYKHRKKLPHQLSGGEQQRVAIARSLAHRPPLLLADEPTGNLDSKNSDLVSQLLVDTCKMENTSLLMVTHSEKVANLTDQQWFLDNAVLRSI